MGKLTLIGTGHVFDIGQIVHDAVIALHPQVVCVELDQGRLQALLARRRGEPLPPPKGFVHKKLQQFQEGVAGMYGAEVGNEMLAGVDAGRAIGARVALIDNPAQNTLKRVVKEMTWREKGHIMGQFVKGIFKRGNKGDLEKELQAYQQNPTLALDKLGNEYPTVKRILIDERDAAMAARIEKLMHLGDVVAILGDGHVEGMAAMLAAHEPTLYRLDDVRQGRLPRGLQATGNSTEVSFGFTLGTTGAPK